MHMTIEEVARQTNKTPKAVRDWVRLHGCPTVRRGGKGAGNGALIDTARFGAWWRKFQKQRPNAMAEFFNTHHPGVNPIRNVVDVYRENAINALGAMLFSYATDPDDCGKCDFRALGLTPEQVQGVAWQIYLLSAMCLGSLQVDGFDERLQKSTGLDCDDLFSMLTEGDFRTDWEEPTFNIPPRIAAFIPDDVASRIGPKEARDE